MLRILINAFWWLFAADGVASLLRELGLLGGAAWIGHLFPLLALLATLPATGALVVTPRAPKRILVPMILFLWWGGPCMAFPLVLLDNFSGAGLWLAGAQVMLALAIYASFRAPGSPWFSPFEEKGGKLFRWLHLLVAGSLTVIVTVGMLVLAFGSNAAAGLTQVSGGYVRLRPDGLYMMERRFQAGGREVRLVGMMHIAEKQFYADVLPEADATPATVVLVEGVTDHKGLLGNAKLGYARLAAWLGITAQEESEFTAEIVKGLQKKENSALNFKHSDVDVETFHPKTIAFIMAIMGVFNAKDWREALRLAGDPASPLNDQTASAQVMQDILYARNQNLVKEIQSSLKEHRTVIVAWGAMHLPEVEAWLRKNDFKQSAQIERKALGFW